MPVFATQTPTTCALRSLVTHTGTKRTVDPSFSVVTEVGFWKSSTGFAPTDGMSVYDTRMHRCIHVGLNFACHDSHPSRARHMEQQHRHAACASAPSPHTGLFTAQAQAIRGCYLYQLACKHSPVLVITHDGTGAASQGPPWGLPQRWC